VDAESATTPESSMTAWVIIGLWTTCAIAAWRPALRFLCDDIKPDEWIFVGLTLFFATAFAALGGPLILAAILFRATVAQRVDPETFVQTLAGAPREERLALRVRQLEQRNADLERDLGL
jgi:hypothetical protein